MVIHLKSESGAYLTRQLGVQPRKFRSHCLTKWIPGEVPTKRIQLYAVCGQRKQHPNCVKLRQNTKLLSREYAIDELFF